MLFSTLNFVIPSRKYGLLAALLLSCRVVAESVPSVELQLTNTLDSERNQQQVYLPLQQLPQALDLSKLVLMEGEHLVNHQLIDSGFDGTVDALLLVSDFAPKQTKRLTLLSTSGQPQPLGKKQKGTYAELAVRVGGSKNEKGVYAGGQYVPMQSYTLPAHHVAGNKLFKYEGLGWESAQIGYRYYYDNRGAIDIFGKSQPAILLEKVGLDGDDYHAMDDWGMDILKVGDSFGLGAIGAMVEGQVVKVTEFNDSYVTIQNNSLSSEIRLVHNQWQVGEQKVDLQQRFRIVKGSPMTEVTGSIKHQAITWATGIVNHNVDQWRGADQSRQWCYLATYGKQSLADDLLGMAIVHRCNEVEQQSTDKHNHSLQFKGPASQVAYYFLANWQGENNGISSKQAYEKYLQQRVLELANPIKIIIRQ